MDNFKCLTAFGCDNLNKSDTNVSVDFIDSCETLHRELSKSLNIAKKFHEELKLANLEKVELIVRLYECNKMNEFFRNQFSSQDEKVKNLGQKLVEFESKLENLSNTKLATNNRFVSDSVSIKPKNKIYIPPFKRNHKEKAYVARLDKGKSFDIDAEVSKPKSNPTVREHNKSVFVPTCHFCGVVGHIRPNYSLLRQKPKSETRCDVRNIDVPKFVLFCHFCGVPSHIHPNCHKLKFRHSVF